MALRSTTMATKGLTILETRDRSRLEEITNFIWPLNFKKEVCVDVAIDDNEPFIRSKVTRTRYFVGVNPNISLDDIKKHLLEKGYITE